MAVKVLYASQLFKLLHHDFIQIVAQEAILCFVLTFSLHYEVILVKVGRVYKLSFIRNVIQNTCPVWAE
jgi:hypothetical protein